MSHFKGKVGDSSGPNVSARKKGGEPCFKLTSFILTRLLLTNGFGFTLSKRRAIFSYDPAATPYLANYPYKNRCVSKAPRPN